MRLVRPRSRRTPLFMSSLDKVGDRYDGSAQVLCLGCQRLYNDLDAAARAASRRRSWAAVRRAPHRSPCCLTSLRAAWRQGGADAAARGGTRSAVARSPVELSVAAASRRLKRCGLRCRCGAESSLAFAHATAAFAHATAVCAHPLAAVSHFAAHPHRPPSSVTNVPLSATPGSPFAWSFDRVVAGSAYSMAGVQPVLHRYNDAKYVWPDIEARAWLPALWRRMAATGRGSMTDTRPQRSSTSSLPATIVLE